MKRINVAFVGFLGVVLSLTLVASAVAGASSAQKILPYEGQIKSIKIDKCGMQPGSCDGSIILAKASDKSEVRLAIKPGSWLKRGDQFVTIDELGVGNYVKVEAIQIPGQELQQISVLSSGGD